MMTDLFNKMSSVCQRKCIAVSEAELHVGEMSCIDAASAPPQAHDEVGEGPQEASSADMKRQQEAQG